MTREEHTSLHHAGRRKNKKDALSLGAISCGK
jgi:hypothetical protein